VELALIGDPDLFHEFFAMAQNGSRQVRWCPASMRPAAKDARRDCMAISISAVELQRLKLVDGFAKGLAVVGHISASGPAPIARAAPSEQAAALSRPPSRPFIAYVKPLPT
jgi:hypothetical protein